MIGIFGCYKSAPKYDVRKIEIRKVDFEITSIISVDCENLEDYFKDDVTTSFIESQEDLKTFSSYLDSLTEDKEGYFPDVRAKILIHHDNDKIDTLCMSDLGMVYNGIPMLLDPKIKQFVESH